MRETAVWDVPVAAAMPRVLQWVAFGGVVSGVLVTTVSTCSSVTERGAPQRGSSSRPSRRFSTNRRRHLPTVWAATRSSWATAAFVLPAAQAGTIRLRRAVA